MAAAWLLQTDLKEKLSSFFRNKTAFILASVYLLHVVGLLWTSDFTPAFNDLRVKLPLLLFPLFLSSGPVLSKRQAAIVMEVFAAAVTASVLVSFAVYLRIIQRDITDIRQISLFVSHIRLSLMICIAIVYHLYKWKSSKNNILIYRSIAIISALLFLFITGSITGIAILLILISIVGLRRVFRLPVIPRTVITATFAVVMLAGSSVVFIEIRSLLDHKEEDLSELESHTIQGNKYEHYLENDDREEGRRVYVYISWEELMNAWPNRSSFDFEGKDRKGQELKYTLVRYMTALGLRKDAEGFDKLSEEDIRNVENGITNPVYKESGLRARLHQVIWELDHYSRGNDPSGHSVSMRLEFWKNGFAVFEQHPILGVGTGDVKNELSGMYEARKSQLQERWRLRPHNQYLTFALTFGIIGVSWFILTLLYPALKVQHILYTSFMTVIIVSMLTEDTLETQQGVTLYAFMNSFLLFAFLKDEYKKGKEVISGYEPL